MIIQLISLNEVLAQSFTLSKILKPNESTLSLKLFKLNSEVHECFLFLFIFEGKKKEINPKLALTSFSGCHTCDDIL